MMKSVRVFLNALTILSIILLVGIVAMCGRSYFAENKVLVQYPWQLVSSRGSVALNNDPSIQTALRERSDILAASKRSSTMLRTQTDRLKGASSDEFNSVMDNLNKHIDQVQRNSARLKTAIPVPTRIEHRCHYAVVAIPFAILPTSLIIRRFRAKRRSRLNRCLICGYDLRATPERCPECGTVVAKCGN